MAMGSTSGLLNGMSQTSLRTLIVSPLQNSNARWTIRGVGANDQVAHLWFSTNLVQWEDLGIAAMCEPQTARFILEDPASFSHPAGFHRISR